MSLRRLEAALRDMELIELGQFLEEGMPVHPSHPHFYKMPWHSIALGDPCNDNQLLLNEHSGTHVDSYGHYLADGGYETIDGISVFSLCGRCVTIDATFLKAGETLEREHLLRWEQAHGRLAPQIVVLIDLGWMRHWRLRPETGPFCHGYPGVGASAAQLLADRKVKLVGVDTLSVDSDGAAGDPAHHILLSNRIAVAENLTNLGMLHGRQGYFVMLPLRIRGGSASPVRPVVLVDAKPLAEGTPVPH